MKNIHPINVWLTFFQVALADSLAHVISNFFTLFTKNTFLFFSLVTLQKYNTSSISFLLLSFIFLVKSPFIHFVSIDYISLSNYNLFCNTKFFYIWNINYNSITTLTQIKPLKLCINTLHFSIIKVVNVVTRFSSFTNEDIYVEWKKKKNQNLDLKYFHIEEYNTN